MRNTPLLPINRQNNLPKASDKPWYKIVNKAKSDVTKVYIYDAIGGWFGIEVNDFIKELNDIETKEIHLHINSPGGSVYDGIAIYNSLKQHDAKVTTYIDALAASAASFIAMAGETVIAARNSTVMIHDAMGVCMGNQSDMLETADLLDKVSDNIADIYAYNAGGDAAEWRALM
jgi:ATP-dependent protease ClpP protease subunit